MNHPVGMNEAMSTEAANADIRLETKSALELVSLINANDKTVAAAVEKALPEVAEAVEVIVGKMKAGGRLFYIGAGTSGRLGIVDASECPPTYGVSPELVQGLIAGGRDAVFVAQEGAEDDAEQGALDLLSRGFVAGDVVCGLSTSGRTPYVAGALRKAKELGAPALVIVCNRESLLEELADIAMVAETGPEVVAGSTRMKAGTAEKMILNMLSTSVMIRLGLVSGNRMTHMNISCEKLRYRATRILMDELGIDEAEALRQLEIHHDDIQAVINANSQ